MQHSTTATTPNGKVNGIVTSISSPIAPHSTLDSAAAAKRMQERENLSNIIAQWNANRLDLFEISEPNEDLEFYGVMRFYFQDAGQKVATKCMRISSTASTVDVISNLIEKFRPDIRMLSVPEYALYEIHENGEERKLADEEMPLLVQLNWHKDDREGRFLLRRMDEKTYLPGFSTENSNILNRKLSKREKKEKKKREKKEKAAGKANGDAKGKDSLAEKLYTELPETSFTRSISNPEAVMRRRRQQKLEKKLQQFSQEGGSEAGGTLRIFGESINQDVPYKTILLSTKDTTAFAVKEILEKYGKEKEDPTQFCLVQMIVPYMNGDASRNGVTAGQPLSNVNGTSIRESILDDEDCPLIIERNHDKSRGVLTFHIRRRPSDFQPRKRKKKPGQMMDSSAASDTNSITKSTIEDNVNGSKVLPFLVEVNPDGTEIIRPNITPRKHFLYMNVTEVGSEVSNNSAPNNTSNNKTASNRNSLQLFGPNVQPRHCVIAHTEGIVTVTPCSRDAETTVNGTRIYETTILKHGMVVRFGKLHTFKFIDEMALRRHSQLSTGPIIGQHFQQSSTVSHQSLTGSDFGNSVPYETTFDTDGKVETSNVPKVTDTGSFNSGSLQRHQTVGSLPRSTNANSQQNFAQTRGPPAPNTNAIPRKGDNILPAILEVWEEIEDMFLNMIIKRVDHNHVQFKLCVTYCLYMVTRYRASTYFKPEITPETRASRLITFCIKYAKIIQQTIYEHHRDQSSLAFWLANSSELLHFLKHDRHLSAFTFDSQDILTEAVQMAFTCLVNCQQHELQDALSTFTNDMMDQSDNPLSQMTNKTLNVLSNSMQLLRRFRVNAALTIQLFSQLFHFINMWLFNKVIGTAESNFCSRHFGSKLKYCLVQIELWAEKQGLELAAECHLSRIVQTSQFLQATKNNEDFTLMVSNFFKLNSLQLRALFERYQPMSDEMPFIAEQIENAIKMSRSTTDELILKDGREIRLEEEIDLQLPFLLPEDGYSCDIVRGIPAGLQEFVQTLVQARVCHLTIQPTASGYWTIYFINFQPDSLAPQMIQQEYPVNNNEDAMKNQLESSSVKNMNVPMTDHKQSVSNSQIINNQSGQFIAPKPPMNNNNNVNNNIPAQMGAHKPNMVPNMMPGYNGFNTLRTMPEPEVQVIKLQKSNNGIGLSIVAARGTNQSQLGIYIKSVVKGGAADLDGRLEAGDQLLKVDGCSLIGITQERAAELMTQTGPIVTLEVAKQGALYHGLGGILNQQASTALLNKNMGSLRFVPNSQEYGSHRIVGHVNSLHPQYPHARLPTYNSMPAMHQILPNYRQMGPNSQMPISYNSAANMRPDSQLSCNSQTNVLNSPLVNTMRSTRFVSQQALSNNNQMVNYQNMPMPNGTLRAPSQATLNRTGPPQPAPKPYRPPSSSGSIQSQPPTQVSCRYGPSGYPSKSTNNIPTNRSDMHNSGVVSPSPWEREEKEKEIQQKIEDTKRSRDDEIKFIESLPYRNPKNEERLRKLILEREFQKRAEHFEEEEEEDDDDEVLDRADQRERMLSMKQDIERTRQRRIEQRYGNDVVPGTKLNKTLEEHQERLKQLRLEEEAAQQAEEKLLQEAKKRQQDDELKVSRGILKSSNIQPANVNLPDSDIPPPLPNSPPPMESANQRLDRLINSTVVKASDDDVPVNTAPMRTGVLKSSNYNSEGSSAIVGDKSVKKVSWNDNPSTTVLNESDQSEEAEDEEPQEDRFSLQDIDDVLGAPAGSGKDWLNNYVSGNTPGVIGAQEVYNDPRKRIEAERMKSNQSQSSSDKVLPEKLSFQEKMKMFAKSTGEMEEAPVRNKAKPT